MSLAIESVSAENIWIWISKLHLFEKVRFLVVESRQQLMENNDEILPNNVLAR